MMEGQGVLAGQLWSWAHNWKITMFIFGVTLLTIRPYFIQSGKSCVTERVMKPEIAFLVSGRMRTVRDSCQLESKLDALYTGPFDAFLVTDSPIDACENTYKIKRYKIMDVLERHKEDEFVAARGGMNNIRQWFKLKIAINLMIDYESMKQHHYSYLVRYREDYDALKNIDSLFPLGSSIYMHTDFFAIAERNIAIMAFDLLDSIDFYFGKQMDYFVIDETNMANSDRKMGYAKFEWLCLPSFVGEDLLKSWRNNASSFLNSLANANRMVLNKNNGYGLCKENLSGPNISFSSERIFLLNNLRFASVKDGRIGSLRQSRKNTELKP